MPWGMNALRTNTTPCFAQAASGSDPPVAAMLGPAHMGREPERFQPLLRGLPGASRSTGKDSLLQPTPEKLTLSTTYGSMVGNGLHP